MKREATISADYCQSGACPRSGRPEGALLEQLAPPCPCGATATRGSQAARRGFSFAEVMFAVVILGIGFIMVAAVFPVAIQQTQSNGEENLAAALARQAANSIAALPTTMTNPGYVPGTAVAAAPTPIDPKTVQTLLLFPPTVKNYVLGNTAPASATIPYTSPETGITITVAPPAVVVPFIGSRWDLVKSNVILPSDPRYAYVMFYKRENNSSIAQLYVIAVAVRNRSTYDPSNSVPDLTSPYATSTVTLAAGDLKSVAQAAQAFTTICPDSIIPTGAAAEGRYVEIPLPSVSPYTNPAGRTYGIGRQFNLSANQFELTPGDSIELGSGSTGLWGTTAAAATPPNQYPITDTTTYPQTAQLYSPATLQPTVAYATLAATSTVPNGTITLYNIAPINPASGASSGTSQPPTCAAPGAFVIIADDFPYNPNPAAAGTTNPQDYQLPQNILPATSGAILPSYSMGSLNGRIFRLGAPVPVNLNATPPILPGTFNLDPAYGMRPAPPAGAGLVSYSPDTVPNPDMVTLNGGVYQGPPFGTNCAKVFMIGAGRTTPGSATDLSVTGPAQDLGIFATFLQVQ